MNAFEDVRVLPRFTEREGVKLTELSGKFNRFVLAQVLAPKKDDLALQQGSPDELNAESHSRAQLENQTRKELADVDRRLGGSSRRSRKASAQLIYGTSLMACQLRKASLKESSRRQNPVFPFSSRTDER